MKRVAKYLPVVTIVLAVVAGGAMAAPLVFVDPVAVDACGEVTVDVVINDEVAGLTGFDLLIDFDETILEYVTAVEGELLLGYPGGHFFYATDEGTTSNALLINGAVLGGSIDGPGVLATITFSCLADGLTDLHFEDAVFRDIDNNPLAVVSEDAQVDSHSDATVYLHPAIVAEEIGTPFTMWLRVGEGIDDVDAVDLTISFDAAVLETLAVHPGADLPGGQGALAVTGGVGSITVVIDPPTSISGAGSILEIEFNGIHEGNFTDVAIDGLVLGTTTGTVIQPCIGDALVTITGPSALEHIRWGVIKSLYR